MRSRGGGGDGDVYEVVDDTVSSRSGEEEERDQNPQRSELNYGSDSSSSRNNNNNNNPIEYTDSERAELLRRLDSIKYHLLRGGGNGNASDNKPKDSNQNQNQNQPFLRPIHLHAPNLGPSGPGPSYYNPYPDPYAPPVHGMYHHPPPQDPYGGYQIHRRPPPIPIPNPNWCPPSHQYANPMARYGQYVEIGSDIVEPQSFFPATPSRYNDMPPYSPVSSSSQPHSHFPATPGRYNDMPPYSPVSSSSHQHRYGEKPYNNSSSFPSSMSSPGPSVRGGGYARWPSDIDSEMGNGNGAFARGYVKKAVSDSDPRRCCHPLAGGAPFIACHSCFELLRVPKKKLLAQEDDERRRYKLQCGACSQIIRFKIVDKKLVFEEKEEETKPVSVSLEVVEDRNIITTNKVVEAQENFDAEEEEEEPIPESRNHRSESRCSEEEERSRSSVSNEQERKKDAKSVRRRAKADTESAATDSASLLELFEYSNVNRAALAYGMAQIGYNKPEKQEPFSKQEPESEVVTATETEFSSSYNGYSNTEISEDSRYSNGREDDNNKSGSNTEITIERNKVEGSLEVWVNGHLIPEDLVISAEKLAGPIQAGKYWYDYRAGFWGAMGKPCLGIIPPFIEEFSHPMPDNCGMGNTQVFVNGRELHKRDYELLVGRGLPQDKNRSYIVDISGRVLDGDSGDELKSLGKLAPTIEKVKHGFGMRVPRSLASWKQS